MVSSLGITIKKRTQSSVGGKWHTSMAGSRIGINAVAVNHKYMFHVSFCNICSRDERQMKNKAICLAATITESCIITTHSYTLLFMF